MKYLSIIIPCYNVADFLPDTIQSLRNLRGAQECEFIFINDGSTDNTLSLIQNFAKEDNRVVIINQKNAGVSAARNAALKIAKGELILPLDGDDRLRPNAVEVIRAEIKDADMLLTPVEVIGSEHVHIRKTNIRKGAYSLYELYTSCTIFPTAPKLVYRTAIIRDNNIRFDEDIHSGEVYTFTCHFLSYCHVVMVSDRCFYQYVMRATSAIHAPNFTKDLSVLTIIDRITSYSATDICKLPSFHLTLFRMCTSFTYNKYAKLGLTNKEALNVVCQMFQHTLYRKCLSNVAHSKKIPARDRILAIYMLTTRIWGYKLMAHLMRIIKI